jgi:uncharacterized protein (DUF433 family)
VGLYTVADAARYIEEARPRLARWAQGYTFRRGGEQRYSGPVLQRGVPGLAELRVLTFLDMVELKLIGVLRRLRIPLMRIRRAGEIAAREWGIAHSFATREIFTDGTRLLHHWGLDGTGRVAEVGSSQIAFEDLARPFYRALDFGDEPVPERYWPMGRSAGIVLDPGRSFGQPIDERSGVPTRVLYEMAEGGSTAETIAWWYELDAAAVRRGVEFERALRR